MALVLGTNCGFVTVAPVTNPNESAAGTDALSRALKVTSAADATKITEVGWWCDSATPEANFEVGLYSHDAGNDVPLNRLYVDATNAKGTDTGWKTVAVDWAISGSTTYWLAFQLDDTTPNTNYNYKTSGGLISIMSAQTALVDPWVEAGPASYLIGLYAVYESPSYSELAGTIAGQSSVSGNLNTTSVSALSGTISAASSVSGNLGSNIIILNLNASIKRLVVAGKNRIYFEDI